MVIDRLPPGFQPSWKAVYDQNEIDYRIAVGNDPVEAVLIAGYFLFGKTDNFTNEEFEKIRKLLLQQRGWVEAYTDFRGDYFIATGNCPLAVSINSVIKRVSAEYPSIKFMIPEDGTFISIENFCIPKESKKDDAVYKLLNWLYTKESVKKHYENIWLLPATLSALPELELEDHERALLNMTKQEFEKFHFFKNVFPQAQVRNLWVEVKSF